MIGTAYMILEGDDCFMYNRIVILVKSDNILLKELLITTFDIDYT